MNTYRRLFFFMGTFLESIIFHRGSAAHLMCSQVVAWNNISSKHLMGVEFEPAFLCTGGCHITHWATRPTPSEGTYRAERDSNTCCLHASIGVALSSQGKGVRLKGRRGPTWASWRRPTLLYNVKQFPPRAGLISLCFVGGSMSSRDQLLQKTKKMYTHECTH